MVNVELEAQIHAALETTGGRVAQAAELLGLDAKTLHNHLCNNKDLKARWVSPKVPDATPASEALMISRPLPIDIPTNKEADIAAAIEREDALVKSGLDSLGLSTEARDVAMACQKFQRNHYRRAIEMLGGGITKNFFELDAQVKAISAQLDDTLVSITPEREMMLREDRSRLLNLMVQMFDRADRATLTAAKVKALLNQKSDQKERPSKPGFSPLVAVSGTNVTINEKK